MKIAYIITEDSKLFGLFDVVDMLRDANELAGMYASEKPAFNVKFVGREAGKMRYQEFVEIDIDKSIKEDFAADLILIPAFNKGDYAGHIEKYKDLTVWLIEQHERGARLCSLCSGAFLLAATGLLDGKHCTTHWVGREVFQKLFPRVNLVSQYILTSHGRLLTSGGSTNALIAVIYIIKQHFGDVIASQLSKLYEIDLDRISQLHFEIFAPNRSHGDEEVTRAQSFIEANFASIKSIQEVCEQTSLGERQFFRRFKETVRDTPFRYLQKVRVEAAKQSLAVTRLSVQEIAYQVGYNEVGSFRKVFKEITGINPVEYRQKNRLDYWKEAVLGAEG